MTDRRPYAGWDLDPDPLTVEPEPVRRSRPPVDDPSPLIVLWICAAAIVLIILGAVIANTAAPRPARPSASPVPAQSGGLTGAPQPVYSGEAGHRLGETVYRPGSSPASGLSGAPPRYRGTATWYCSTVATCTAGYGPGDLIGAIDRKDSAFRPGDRVTVRAFGRVVTVTIVDTCACGGVRVIDLSRAAFARLANPDLGVIPVTIERADDPLPTAPGTDVRGVQ